MTAAFATLTFLSVFWLLAVVSAMVLERSGGKILAALKGEVAPLPVQSASIRIRYRQRGAEVMRTPVRITPRLRVAA